jgi:hypothetical protein
MERRSNRLPTRGRPGRNYLRNDLGLEPTLYMKVSKGPPFRIRFPPFLKKGRPSMTPPIVVQVLQPNCYFLELSPLPPKDQPMSLF